MRQREALQEGGDVREPGAKLATSVTGPAPVAASEPATSPPASVPADVARGSTIDELDRLTVGWVILQALHENVSEDDRPQSWSDLDQNHEQRIQAAAVAAIECIRNRDTDVLRERDKARDVARGMMKALEPFADEANRFDPDEDDDQSEARTWFTIGDLRDARAALQAARAAGIGPENEHDTGTPGKPRPMTGLDAAVVNEALKHPGGE